MLGHGALAPHNRYIELLHTCSLIVGGKVCVPLHQVWHSPCVDRLEHLAPDSFLGLENFGKEDIMVIYFLPQVSYRGTVINNA